MSLARRQFLGLAALAALPRMAFAQGAILRAELPKWAKVIAEARIPQVD